MGEYTKTTEKIISIGLIFISSMGLILGLFFLIDGHTTMQQIQAFGSIGQIAAKEQYAIATQRFSIGLFSSTIAMLLAIISTINYYSIKTREDIERLRQEVN